MRDLITTARRFLETRKTVRGLEREEETCGSLSSLDATRLLVFRGAAQALAWALEIDFTHLHTPPSLRNLPEPPTRVRLHRVEVGDRRLQTATYRSGHEHGQGQEQVQGQASSHMRRMWLAEIPAHHDLLDPDFSTESWSCFLSDQQAYDLYLALGEALIPVETPTAATLSRLAGQRQPALQPATHRMRFQPDTEDGYAGIGARHNHPPQPPAAAAGAASPTGPTGPDASSGSSRFSGRPPEPRSPRTPQRPQRPQKGA